MTANRRSPQAGLLELVWIVPSTWRPV